MTADKRHIPINHGRAAGAAKAAGGAGNPAHGGGHASAGHSSGGGAADLKALQAEVERLAADLETLQTERDALAEERDALATERDGLASERDGLNDQLLRLRAEFDNYRRRATREAFEAGNRAQCDLLTDVLPVLDNLERALDAAEHHQEGKVLDGVRMTRDMFVNLLTRSGVEEIEGAGAEFDPQVHDAMVVQPSEHDEGKVAAVIEKGYRQGERVLRPARVVVSAGPGGPAGGTDGGAGGGTA